MPTDSCCIMQDAAASMMDQQAAQAQLATAGGLESAAQNCKGC
jgi:hypothetical protein